ncbi:hypothetical protein [Microbulbifer sp. MCCC 1A16149]|uniref:hypothetical protein n=1 Tax=Microbulbifer sp. MCCC 1A16149 TaxID=3411322 RepID=UPI003D144E7D
MSTNASASTPEVPPGSGWDASKQVADRSGLSQTELDNIDPQSVARPRAVGWELVLFIATFGLYFSYYLYRLTKDCRTINREPVSPGWWILTPYFLLAQFFAYPRLLRLLENAETRCQLPPAWGGWQKAWLIGMWVVTLLINIADKVPNSDQWFVAVFFVGTVLFSVLHTRVNRIRSAYWEQLSENPIPARRFHAIEWVISVVCLPVATVLLCVLLFYTQLFGGNQLQQLNNGDIASQEGHPFSIEVKGDHWARVEIGSHSDGTALMELEGANTDAYFVVFPHGKESSLDQISAFRTEEASAEFMQTSCKENREFLDGGDHTGSQIMASLTCEGSLLGNKVLVTSRSIETDQGIYELYGQLIATKADFAHSLADYQSTEKGFRPL